MTTEKNGWHDEHLQTALKNAPDNNAQANEHVRNHVLDYANTAINKQPTWLNQLKNWLFKDHFANAQWAGFTGVAAMLLMTVLLWRQHPEEAVWISSSPKDILENNISAEKSVQIDGRANQNSKPTNTQALPATTDSQNASTLQSTPIANENESSNQPLLKSKEIDRPITERKRLTELSEVDQHEQPANSKLEATNTEANKMEEALSESLAAPAPIATKPSVAATSPSDLLGKQKSTTQEINNKKIQGASVNTNAEPSKVDQMSADELSQPKPSLTSELSIQSTEYDVLANMLIDQGGQALAMRDIQSDKFRLFQLNPQQKQLSKNGPKCQEIISSGITDAETGYKVEILDSCTYSEALVKAVGAYNQTMRNWHLDQH